MRLNINYTLPVILTVLTTQICGFWPSRVTPQATKMCRGTIQNLLTNNLKQPARYTNATTQALCSMMDNYGDKLQGTTELYTDIDQRCSHVVHKLQNKQSSKTPYSKTQKHKMYTTLAHIAETQKHNPHATQLVAEIAANKQNVSEIILPEVWDEIRETLSSEYQYLVGDTKEKQDIDKVKKLLQDLDTLGTLNFNWIRNSNLIWDLEQTQLFRNCMTPSRLCEFRQLKRDLYFLQQGEPKHLFLREDDMSEVVSKLEPFDNDPVKDATKKAQIIFTLRTKQFLKEIGKDAQIIQNMRNAVQAYENRQHSYQHLKGLFCNTSYFHAIQKNLKNSYNRGIVYTALAGLGINVLGSL